TGAGSYDYDFLIVSSKLYVKSSDGTNQIVNFAGTQTLQSNTWYYVNYVWDGTTNTNAVRVYVNGVIDKTGTATGANATITTSHTLYISGSSYEMNGLIDGVRIYNRALSATEISYQYNQSKPIAQWKFDEGSGNYAYDSSGNANTGSLSLGGSATSSAWVSGVYGGAMNFDGVDDYVSMGEPAILNLTGPFALSAWLYPTPPHLQGYGGIYGNRSGNGERILLLDDGSLLAQYTIGGAGKSVTTAVGSVPSNKWSFVSLIYDGSEIAFWINGVKQTPVGATGAVYNSAGTRQIGWGNNTVGYYNFKGKMDDVRIYQYARTAEQVKQDYNDGKAVYVGTRITDCDKSPADCVNSGLVGYWGMDEMGSTTVKDLSGNNNNGLLGGGTAAAWPFWTQGVQPFSGGRPGGGALKFDGVDDYVDIGDPSSGILDFGTGSFSVSLWVKAPTTGGNANQYGGIFKGCGDGNIQSGWLIRLYNYGSSISFYGGNGTSNVFDVATTRSNNVWTNVVGVLDRSAGKAYIYRDGVLASTDTTITNGDISSTRSLTIARDYSATKNLQGIIDEVKIYNRALSDAEIRYQYNQGKPIAWYKMDEGADTATTCNATRSTVYDSSPSAYNLDLHLGTATTTVWADGKYSCGLQFNGTNDYASSSNSVSMATGTLSFWAKPNTTTQKLLQLTAGNYVQLISGVASTTGFGTPTIYIDGKQTTTFPDTNWHHITVVSTASITANATYLGRVGTSYYNGLLDDVRIYNYGLTADQVRNVYNAGALYSGQ
ncbi:MAG: LamG domain-containing protein, partial [Candidatus Gribaldobacteria bacterium]|nr:LamG domain-containing protein [Candidatus Gribaldobacteria bacterium]